MKITDSKVIYDCGCEFDIKSKNPLRIKFNPDFEAINKHCDATWSLISSGNTKGVFQLESQLGQNNAKKLKPSCHKDLSALITLIRPGCLEAKLEDGRSITEHYIARKNGIEPSVCEYEVLEPILKDEYNLLIYQEQILQISREIAGFTYSESEVLRKCISGDSLMMTESGHVPIRDLCGKQKDYGKLLSYNSNGELVYNNIVDVWSNGVKPVYRLLLSNGFYIDATQNHQFLTDNGWTELKDITNNNLIVVIDKSSQNINKLTQSYVYVTKVESIKYLRDEEVFDFSLENQPHAGFVNGVLTHNSIGKKRADIMAKLKDQFIEGCINVGKVTKEEAQNIFSWIEKNARYGFNKSHAVGYAANSYLSAYVKTHFKYAFFTSYLFYAKDKQGKEGKYGEIESLVANAKTMEIDIRPPNLIKCNKNFTHVGDKIYFGLSDIKGIGESAYTNITKAIYQGTSVLNKSREELTWLEFLLFCTPNINSGAVEGLIESGALDYMSIDRQRMIFEYRQFNELTKNEILWLTQNFKEEITLLVDMLKIGINSPNIGKRGGFCLNARIEKINSMINTLVNPPTKVKDNATWLSSVEEARLGTTLTTSVIEGCKGIEQANCNCLDFLNGNCGQTGNIIAVEIIEVKPYTCSNGKVMAFIKARDTYATINCAIFAEQLEKYDDLLIPGNTVMIAGDKSKKGRDSLNIKNVWQLT